MVAQPRSTVPVRALGLSSSFYPAPWRNDETFLIATCAGGRLT